MTSRARRKFQFSFPQESNLPSISLTIIVQLNGKILLPSAESLGIRPGHWPEWIKVTASKTATEYFWYKPGRPELEHEGDEIATKLYIGGGEPTEWRGVLEMEKTKLSPRPKGKWTEFANAPFRLVITE